MKKYGVDMSGLDQAYDEECAGFFSFSSLWRELSGRQVISEPKTVKGESHCVRRLLRRIHVQRVYGSAFRCAFCCV